MSNVIQFPKPLTPYWLCCGDTSREHTKKRNRECLEARMGYREHEHFGTVKEHKVWMDSQYLELS